MFNKFKALTIIVTLMFFTMTPAATSEQMEETTAMYTAQSSRDYYGYGGAIVGWAFNYMPFDPYPLVNPDCYPYCNAAIATDSSNTWVYMYDIFTTIYVDQQAYGRVGNYACHVALISFSPAHGNGDWWGLWGDIDGYWGEWGTGIGFSGCSY